MLYMYGNWNTGYFSLSSCFKDSCEIVVASLGCQSCFLVTVNCDLSSTCSDGVCTTGSTREIAVCVCDPGQQCMGTCEGTVEEVGNTSQSCTGTSLHVIAHL